MLACENIVSCEWYQTPADAEFFIQHPTLNRAAPGVAPAGAKLLKRCFNLRSKYVLLLRLLAQKKNGGGFLT